MIFTIYRIDRASCAGGRDAHRQAHLAYLAPFELAILCAGALWSSQAGDGQNPASIHESLEIGSLYLVEFDTESEAQAFAFNDPFHVAGLFESVEVRLFQARIGTRKNSLTG